MTKQAHVIQLDVVSKEHALFSGKVRRITLSGIQGEMGIEPGHAPLLSLLKPGDVHFETESGQTEALYVSGGIVEVLPTGVIVLADSAIRARDLDEQAILKAQEAAKIQLAKAHTEMDYSTALVELARAAAQLKVLRSQLRKVRR